MALIKIHISRWAMRWDKLISYTARRAGKKPYIYRWARELE
jgi:hypothetical protein